jgi:hypothetical protein
MLPGARTGSKPARGCAGARIFQCALGAIWSLPCAERPASEATTDLVDVSDPDLQGRSAIVTGATGGIGLSIATALARAGVHVTFDHVARYAVAVSDQPLRAKRD